MSNINQKIYFLSLQRYLPLNELMSFLSLDIDEIKLLIERYNRNYCENQEEYFDKILSKKFLLMPEVVKFILYNKHNKKFRIADILNEFMLEKNYLVNYLYYIIKINPKLAQILYINEYFLEEIKYEFKLSAINRASTKVKLFRNNLLRTEELLTYSRDKSIEEISLIFACSPSVVEDELIFLKIGGFWNNENIRANTPYFVGQDNKKFAIAEILFIIENINLDINTLARRVKTTTKNLSEIINIINSIEMEKELIKDFVLSKDNYIYSEWIKIKAVLNFNKDNREYIKSYPFLDLFEEEEIHQFDTLKEEINSKMNYMKISIEKKDKIYYIFALKSERKIIGSIIYSNEFYKCIENSENKEILYIENNDILFYRKLKI